MNRIVAIGGGEIGRPGFPVETLDLDAEVVRLAGKRRPRVLFLPTATGDDPGYEYIKPTGDGSDDEVMLYQLRDGERGAALQLSLAAVEIDFSICNHG